MRSIGRSLLSLRRRVPSAPGLKRLAGLSCLDLRKEIQNSARRNLRTKAVWEQYINEVCKRIQRHEDAAKEEQVDMFTPTDISLIFSSFASARKRVPNFINYMLETARGSINKYELRDLAVLYNGLAKLGVQGDNMINGFNSSIEAKLNARTSEKDIALLLNALLELDVKGLTGIFVKSSLIISSRIKYISNCHTLTLLLHSYSRLKGLAKQGARPEVLQLSQPDVEHQVAEGPSSSVLMNLKDVCAVETEPDGGNGTPGEEVQSPEDILISETTLSLLGRCADIMLQMRPTDLMYLYKAAFNLIYVNSEGITQQLYASMVSMHKLHIRIREHLLEFEARELITLLQTFEKLDSTVQQYSQLDCDGALWVLNNEIRNTIPSLREEVVNELAYRSRVMSFADCLEFIKLLDVTDHRGVLVSSRLAYKLNKTNSWERYQRMQLWELIYCLHRRSAVATSKEAQELMVAITRNITGTLKLREVELMANLAARLGAKSGALLKKTMSVPCRADALQPSQAASLVYHLTGLGYIDHLGPILDACAKVESAEDALKVLTAMAILKVNGLMEAPEPLVLRMSELLQSGMEMQDADSTNKIALLRAAGLVDTPEQRRRYTFYPRLYAGQDYVTIRSMQLGANNKLNMDCQVISLPQCIEDIADGLQQFLAKFGQNTRLLRQYHVGDVEVPIVLQFAGETKVAVHVLMNDFYSGKRQMLRIDVYAQLKLIEQCGMRAVCCLAQDYLFGDRTQFIAQLVERCHSAAVVEANKEREAHRTAAIMKCTKQLDVPLQKTDSFSRFRMLVIDRGAMAQKVN